MILFGLMMTMADNDIMVEKIQLAQSEPVYSVLNIYHVVTICGVFASAILGSQRFALPYIYSYACLIPILIGLLIFNKDVMRRNTLIIIALFLSVDQTSNYYIGTPDYIRYAIDAIAILSFFYHTSFSISRLLTSLVILFIPLVLSLYCINELQWSEVVRDFLMAGLAIIIYSCSASSLDCHKIDVALLAKFLVVYIIAECVNTIAHFSFLSTDYLNFNSTKSLVVFASLYFLNYFRYKLGIVLVFLTYIVLVGYVTRMIILTYTMVLCAFFLFSLIRLHCKFLFLLFLSIIVITYFLIRVEHKSVEKIVEKAKISAAIKQTLYGADFFKVLKKIDHVRYIENEMFFSQELPFILFGKGFGTGIKDRKGLLDFVTSNDTAFAQRELEQRQFYNFHDVWVDIGLRFWFVIYSIFFYPNYSQFL